MSERREVAKRIRGQQLARARAIERERCDLGWFKTPLSARTCTVFTVDAKALARALLLREEFEETPAPRKEVQKAHEDHDRQTRIA